MEKQVHIHDHTLFLISTDKSHKLSLITFQQFTCARKLARSMELRKYYNSGFVFINLLSSWCLLLLLLLLFSCLSGSAKAYKNYTVGDSLGWFDNLEKPTVNYQKWADSKTFSLGDFLIFNTDNNHSVVQTYNFTTYKECDYDDSLDSDTKLWTAANPSNTATFAVTVAVPLLEEGPTYFFSSDYDGDQCNNGQHFKINVTHGQGLPESLKSPSEQSPAPNSADYNNEDSAPDIVVPSNFNHPHEAKDDDDNDDDDVKKESGSVSLFVNSWNRKLYGFMILLGIVGFF